MIKLTSVTSKIILLIMVVAMILLCNIVLIYKKQIEDAELRHDRSIATLIDYLLVPVEDAIFTGNLTNLQRLANRTIDTGVITAITITYPDGKKIASYPESINSTAPVMEIAVYQSFDDNNFGLENEPTQMPDKKVIGKMLVYPNNNEKIIAQSALNNDMAISLILTLLLIVVIYILIRLLLIKPLEHVFKGAKSILAAQYDDVKALNQKDEIGLLSTYLTDIAQDFSSRDKLQKVQMREIMQTNAELSKVQKERVATINRLLDGITPSLQEAMSTIHLLHDKRSLQANLTKSVLFALSLTEQTKSAVTANSHRILFKPQPLAFNEFCDLLKEYIDFFAEKTNISINLKLERPDDLKHHILMIEKKEVMRILAHVFEFIDNRHSPNQKAASFIIMFSKNETELITIDLIVRSTSEALTDITCAAINSYFAGAGKDEDVNKLKNSLEAEPSYGIQVFTLRSLKTIIDYSKARYAIVRSGSNNVMHTFSFHTFASTDARKVEEHIGSLYSEQDLCAIGSNQFINQFMNRHYGHAEHIKFVTYELAASMNFKPTTHYIIDLINDKTQGLELARKIIGARSKTHNVAAVVSSFELRERSLFAWCDVDFDMLFSDTVTAEDLQKINSRKHISDRDSTVTTILESIKHP